VAGVRQVLRGVSGRAAGGLRRATDPALLRGVAVEVARVTAHVSRYPLGFVKERVRPADDRYSLAGLPPLRRGLLIGDVTAADTPILLVHGLIDNRSIFTKLRRSLRRRGFGHVYAINLPLLTDVQDAAARLADDVEDLCVRTGRDTVHVVAHSLGGLVARYYVQKLGGDARVHTLVTLGTPHGGTNAARLVPHTLVRQMRPGSSVLAALAAPAPGCRTRFVVFSSDLDELIVPTECGRLDHPDLTVRNLRLHGVGHHSMPFDSRVVHEIATVLARLDGPHWPEMNRAGRGTAGRVDSGAAGGTPGMRTAAAAAVPRTVRIDGTAGQLATAAGIGGGGWVEDRPDLSIPTPPA
jgi:pimeloyl-ACP methyl ester carboxylesterase